MDFTKFNEEVNNISSLPNQVTGKASDLKKAFDKGSTDIKEYINNTLIPELQALALEKDLEKEEVNTILQEIYSILSQKIDKLTGKTSELINDGDGSSEFATLQDVAEKIAEITNSAPEALDTLQELANALGNDPDFSTTVLNLIATKLDKTVFDENKEKTEADIAALMENFEFLDNERNLMGNDVTSLTGSVDALGNEICNLDSRVKQTEIYAESHSETISEHSEQISDCKMKLDTLEEENREINKKCDDMSSELDETVKKTDIATEGTAGIVKVAQAAHGLYMGDEYVKIYPASKNEILKRSTNFKPVVPKTLEYAVETCTNQSVDNPEINTSMPVSAVAVSDKITNLKSDLYDYVDNRVGDIVNSAPETLDTLNELAEALGNDENFATTVTAQLGEKVDTKTYEEKMVEIDDNISVLQSEAVNRTQLDERIGYIDCGEIDFSYPDVESMDIECGLYHIRWECSGSSHHGILSKRKLMDEEGWGFWLIHCGEMLYYDDLMGMWVRSTIEEADLEDKLDAKADKDVVSDLEDKLENLGVIDFGGHNSSTVPPDISSMNIMPGIYIVFWEYEAMVNNGMDYVYHNIYGTLNKSYVNDTPEIYFTRGKYTYEWDSATKTWNEV